MSLLFLASEGEYVARALLRLTVVLDTQLSLVKPEAIARLSEAYTSDEEAQLSTHTSFVWRFRHW